MDDGDELADHCAVAERKGLPQAKQPKAKSAPRPATPSAPSSSSASSASSSTCAAATQMSGSNNRTSHSSRRRLTSGSCKNLQCIGLLFNCVFLFLPCISGTRSQYYGADGSDEDLSENGIQACVSTNQAPSLDRIPAAAAQGIRLWWSQGGSDGGAGQNSSAQYSIARRMAMLLAMPELLNFKMRF